MIPTREQMELNKKVLNAIRNGLYGEDGSIDIVASYMTDKEETRFDSYECIKMLRIVMAQLYDISERLKRIEGLEE